MNKQFKSFDELATDPVFINKVGNQLYEVRQKRVMRPAPKAGMRYKRDWYDQMNGTLNAAHFISEIEAIWMQKSSLPAIERNVIKYVCDLAFRETLEYYNNLPDINDLVRDSLPDSIFDKLDKISV